LALLRSKRFIAQSKVISFLFLFIYFKKKGSDLNGTYLSPFLCAICAQALEFR
jgi:hypothetical protein